MAGSVSSADRLSCCCCCSHWCPPPCLGLCRAQQVADRLLPAYDTPTRIPYNIINLATQAAKNPTWNQR